MKLTILLLLILSHGCQSQGLREGCWLPEAYVDSLNRNSFTNLSATIKPVESILVSSDTVLIKSFRGDYLIASLKKTGQDNKLEVLNFGNMISLAYPEAVTYGNMKCFLRQEGDRLIMTIEGEGRSERVQFINRTNDLIFKNPSEVYFRYKLREPYSLSDRKYIFQLNGKIDGVLWNRYELLRSGYPAMDRSSGNYWLVSLVGKNGESKYAVKVTSEGLFLYEYTVVGRTDYDIKVAKNFTYFLKRMRH